jgi:hypothetical protein
MRILTVFLLSAAMTATAYSQRGGVDRGVVDIRALPEKDKDVFDAVSTKHLKKDKAFALGFISVDVATRATYQGKHDGAKAKITILLDGISDEHLQAIADTASKIYERELHAAGYEVAPRSEIEATEGFAKTAEKSAPRRVEKKIPALLKSSGTTHLKSFTAHDGPLWSSKAGKHLYKMTKEMEKGLVIHGFAIGFSTYRVDKDKQYSIDKITTTVEVNALPLLTLGTQATWTAKSGKFGMLNGKQVWTLEKEFVTGFTAVEGEKDTFIWTVDPKVFQEGVIELIETSIKRTVAYFKSESKW